MMSRYKRVPDAAQKARPWIIFSVIAVSIVVVLAIIPWGSLASGANPLVRTTIDFETDAYKTLYKPQTAGAAIIESKGGSMAFGVNGSAYHNFKLPKITDGVYAGKKFGFTMIMGNPSGDIRVIFGSKVYAGWYYPIEQGVIMTTIGRNYLQMCSLTSTTSIFENGFNADKNLALIPSTSIFEFTMESETSYSFTMNGVQVLKYSGNSTFNSLTFNAFEYFSIHASNTPKDVIACYIDNIYVSWQ